MSVAKRKVFGSALIVAGTSIGAGMLALPVVTARGGFFPALLVYTFCWALMTLSGLFFVEISLKMPEGSNLVSMAKRYLGRPGKIASWVLYLFLFYALSTAYISLGGQFLSPILFTSPFWGSLVFLLLFGGICFLGASAVDAINELLMLGLFVAYGGFLLLGSNRVHFDYLARSDFFAALPALPVIFTAFSYQGTVPSLVSYLQRDHRAVKSAIVCGTSLVFFVYVLWQALILGIIPFGGEHGLEQAKALGKSAIQPLRYQRIPGPVYLMGEGFAFCAIATSFLGVNMGLLDFLSDGLRIQKTVYGKMVLSCLAFLPPTLIALFDPAIFLRALDYAGGFGCSILLVLFPTMMVLISRYRRKERERVIAVSRNALLFLVTIVSIGILAQIGHLFLRLSK
ncbi:MAG: aromatic amino acid transport family protein [Chlamydiota bacterium]